MEYDLMLKKQKKTRPHKISIITKELINHRLALFLGSGLSRSSNLAHWKDLLREVAHEIGLDVDKEEHDLVSLAQYYLTSEKETGRRRLEEDIREKLKYGKPNKFHKLITKLPVHSLWTTNYDTLLEDSYEKYAGKEYATVIDIDKALLAKGANSPVVIYKMHGSIRGSGSDMVIGRDDYENYVKLHGGFISALRADLMSKTFLFIGFGFNDPNISYVMRSLKEIMYDETRIHYLFLLKLDENTSAGGDFEYQKQKEFHKIAHLKKYGISTIIVEDVDELYNILKSISLQTKKLNTVLCGSDKSGKYTLLCDMLGYEIIKNEYQLYTCFAKGVGRNAVTGALRRFGEVGEQYPYKKLRIWPTNNEAGDNSQNEELREVMINNAASCVIIGGQSGTLSEFRMAEKLGLFCLPIGYTGGIAEIAHKEVMNNFEKFTKGYNLLPDQKTSILSDLDSLANKISDSETVEIVVRILLTIRSNEGITDK